MRYANLLLFAVLSAQCSRQPASPSPWGLAQRGHAHIQADLTALLDEAVLPSSGNVAPPQRSNIRIKGIGRAGIYMPAPARARFQVFVPPEGRFAAWFAMMPSAWAGSTDGAEFHVSVIGNAPDDSVLLFSTQLNPRVREDDQNWHYLDVALAPWAGSTIMLELQVGPGPSGDSYRDWCMWGEPVVFGPPPMAPALSHDDLDRLLADGLLRLDWCFTATRALPPIEEPDLAFVAPLTSAFPLDGVEREGLYAHPPWSVTRTLVPGPRARLVASLGMVESCWQQSNGAMCIVRAGAPGGPQTTLFEYWLCPRANRCDRRWVDIAVDLGRFAGRPVRLSLETTSGPSSDLICDSVVWGSPRVVSLP